MGIAKGNQIKGTVKSVGNLTFSQLGDDTIVRAKMGSSKSSSKAQQEHRCRFHFVSHLGRCLSTAINKGFQFSAKDRVALNIFIKRNIHQVCTTWDEAEGKFCASIDCSMLVCAYGSLDAPHVTGGVDELARRVHVVVLPFLPGARVGEEDVVYVVVYERVLERCLVYNLGLRTEVDTWEVPLLKDWSADAVEVYSFAKNEVLKLTSPSVYVGGVRG